MTFLTQEGENLPALQERCYASVKDDLHVNLTLAVTSAPFRQTSPVFLKSRETSHSKSGHTCHLGKSTFWQWAALCGWIHERRQGAGAFPCFLARGGPRRAAPHRRASTAAPAQPGGAGESTQPRSSSERVVKIWTKKEGRSNVYVGNRLEEFFCSIYIQEKTFRSQRNVPGEAK